LPRRDELREARHALDAFLLGRGAAESYLGQVAAVQERVAVRVGQAGHGAALAQLDELHVVAGHLLALGARPHAGKLAVAHQRRLRPGAGRIERVQRSHHQEIGHASSRS
jgi:hypothetical protein